MSRKLFIPDAQFSKSDQEILDGIEKSPYVQQLRNQISKKEKLFKQADTESKRIKFAQQIEVLKNTIINFKEKELERISPSEERHTIDEVSRRLEPQEAMNLKASVTAMCFVMDYMEMLIINCNDLIKKAYPECNFVFFKDIVENGKKIAKTLHTVHKDECDEHQELFAEYAESISDYLTKRMKTYHERAYAIQQKQDKQAKSGNA